MEQKSASKRYVRRDVFLEAVDAVLSGTTGNLYVFKLDRLSRLGMGHVGTLLDDFERQGARLVADQDGLDSAMPGHRIVFAILSERAREEAKDIATRTGVGIHAAKRDGLWRGVAPYGLTADPETRKLIHRADEYPTARRIALALLDRVTPFDIAELLNSEGLRTRSGKLWRGSYIMKLISSPAWAGLQPDLEPVLDKAGQRTGKYRQTREPYRVNGKAVKVGKGVVSPGERLRALAIIGERRTHSGHGKPAAQSLLSGLFKCGRCDGRMRGAGRKYSCSNNADIGKAACLGIHTLVERADDTVVSMWHHRVTTLPAGDPVLVEIARRWLTYQDPEKDERRKEVAAELDDAQTRADALDTAHFVKGTVDVDKYDRLSGELAEMIAALDAEARQLAHEADMSLLHDGVMLAEAFAAAPLADQRMLLRCALEGVTVAPAKHPGDKTPLEKRLTAHWVGAPKKRRKVPATKAYQVAA